MQVTGPGGFANALPATTTFGLLLPGAYAVNASDVQAAGKTYRPDPATRSVTLVASASPRSVDVFYGGGTGSLDVTVAGLPAATDASVTVTGPPRLRVC